MTTSTQLLAWLKSDNAKRCVLVQAGVSVAGVETTRFLSNKNYGTYQPVVAGGVTFSESLSLDGTVSLSSGSIEFSNTNGEIDSWLVDIWKNRTVKIYIGDVFWPESDFYLIFDGVIAEQPSAEDRTKVVLTLSDKLQRLNTTLSDVKLGGIGTNKDKLLPYLFGECFNISPLLVDLATHKYQIHNGQIERIIEVRDNGVPVGFTADLTTGTFTLLQQPVGTITCDAQGDCPGGVYVNDPIGIIKRLAKGFGPVATRFVDAEFAASFPASTAVIGEYLTDKTNLLELCNKITSSIGARVAMTRTGLLYIVLLQLPQSSAGTLVTAAEMLERSLHVATVPVVAAVKLGYCKNYTVQSALQTGLPSDQIDLFAQDWPFTSTYSDSATAGKYKLVLNPTTVETSLQAQSDADAETARRGALFGVQRYVATFEGTPQMLLESLGSPITLQHRRFSLAAATRGQIIQIDTDFLKAKTTIGVFL